MLKRWLFFLSYILFFTAIPVLIYHFWPVVHVEEKDMFRDITFSDKADEARVKKLQADSIRELNRRANTIYATLICNYLSAGFSLFLAIRKFKKPEWKISGLITGINIFNVFYFPVCLVINYGFVAFFLIPMFLFGTGMTISIPFSGTAIMLFLYFLIVVSILLNIKGIQKRIYNR
jgi:hypothetical protein